MSTLIEENLPNEGTFCYPVCRGSISGLKNGPRKNYPCAEAKQVSPLLHKINDVA